MKVVSYDLSFEVDFESARVTGKERVLVESVREKLSLDCLGPKVLKVSVDGEDVEFVQDEGAGKVTIAQPPKSDVAIDIEFALKVSEGLFGFYKSKYDGSYILTTDFEPNGARTLFPCIDHPDFKAEFNLSVTTDKGLAVISNTPLRESTPVDGGRRTRFVFEKTPRMSTYLLYLGIGKFEEMSAAAEDSRIVVASTPGHVKKCGFALETAAKLLKAYNAYYSVAYPLAKLHLIAVPEFSPGAMENWGAITFREIGLFVDENTSASEKRHVAVVVAHEMAHQWFGDLVTMKWWNDLWLNESFATFMEAKVIHQLFPDWDIWRDFLLADTGGAMQADALMSTHPIEVKVNSPEEIGQIFDAISYGKGASVLRMVEAYLGEEAFRRGVHSYLKQHEYSNAASSDLWSSFDEASKQPVSSMMEGWVRKAGFPLVRVGLDAGQLRFSQSRFLLNGRSDDTLWPIPLTFDLNGELVKVLLDKKSLEVRVGRVEGIKVNHLQTGFYRVLYDKDLYQIVEREFDLLHTYDRWGVVNDLNAFLISANVDSELYFRFVRKCLDAKDNVVVEEVSAQLGLLRFLSAENREISGQYRNFHSRQLERLGLVSKKGEDDRDKILRGRVAESLALVDEEFASKLSQRFAEYRDVEPDIRAAVVIGHALTTGENGLDGLMDLIRNIKNEGDVVKLFACIRAFKDPRLVERMLDFSIGGEVNRADSIHAVRYASINSAAGDVTWSWLKENLSKMRETFRGSAVIPNLVQRVIPVVGIGRREDVREFFAKGEFPESANAIRRGLEMLDVLTDLKRRLM